MVSVSASTNFSNVSEKLWNNTDKKSGVNNDDNDFIIKFSAHNYSSKHDIFDCNSQDKLALTWWWFFVGGRLVWFYVESTNIYIFLEVKCYVCQSEAKIPKRKFKDKMYQLYTNSTNGTIYTDRAPIFIWILDTRLVW